MKQEIEKYVKENKFIFFECSVKNGLNIDNVFKEVIEILYKKHKDQFVSPQKETFVFYFYFLFYLFIL